MEIFFPNLIRRFNLRLNYRNHRKLVIIDNKIGYIGGFNVGDEYLGLDKNFGFWRDTHIRVEGSAVAGIKFRFLKDFNYASKKQIQELNHFLDHLKQLEILEFKLLHLDQIQNMKILKI